MLEAERKYIVESYSDSKWDLIRKIQRWYWSNKVNKMSEGEVLNVYRLFADKGGESND